MPDNAHLEISARYSPNADWSQPVVTFYTSDEETPSKKIDLVVSAATAGTPVELSSGGTIAYLIVYNRDTTNYVSATFLSAGNSAVPNILRIGPGKTLVLTDVTASGDLVLQANSAVCECDVFGWGS